MRKTITIEEVKQEFINRGLIPLFNEYKNNKTKLLCKDKKGYKYLTTLTVLKKGRKICAFEKRNPHTIDNIKLWLELNEKPYKLLSTKYIDAKTKLKCRCLIDGHEWGITWDKLIRGRGCPKCRDNKNANERKLNLKEIKKRLTSINPDIQIIAGQYKNIHSKLKCKCKIDRYEWESTWNNLSKGKGCPKCANTIKLTIGEIKERMQFINPNILILSKTYINSYTKLECKCKIDDYEWGSPWSNLSKGHGCPECYIRNMSGENHHGWKGGITPLHIYLRTHILQWKQDSMKNCEYKCAVTGDEFNVIHHLVSFDQILQETLDVANLPIHYEVSKYTDGELKLLQDICLKLHYKHGLGVCLTKEIHEEFHNMYGYGSNTKEQFEEFKKIKSKQINNKTKAS